MHSAERGPQQESDPRAFYSEEALHEGDGQLLLPRGLEVRSSRSDAQEHGRVAGRAVTSTVLSGRTGSVVNPPDGCFWVKVIVMAEGDRGLQKVASFLAVGSNASAHPHLLADYRLPTVDGVLEVTSYPPNLPAAVPSPDQRSVVSAAASDLLLCQRPLLADLTRRQWIDASVA